MYLLFSDEHKRAANTITIKPGVLADFDKEDKLIGIEIIDASEIVGKQIEFKLPKAVTV